jgi:hypothetical protein
MPMKAVFTSIQIRYLDHQKFNRRRLPLSFNERYIRTCSADFIESSCVKEVVLLITKRASDVLKRCHQVLRLFEEIIHLAAVGVLESDISAIGILVLLSLTLA